jgi:hypothetical protein
MMVILTTFLAPPLLRFVFPDSDDGTNNSEQLILDASTDKALALETQSSVVSTAGDSGNVS